MPCHPKLYRLLLASPSGYASTYKELVETTDWSRYGRGRDPRCANRMAHCGYEPTAVLATIGLAEGLAARPDGRAARQDQGGADGLHGRL
ncbi:MAG TPA: DUF3463 domain-containing protein [Streptosporangiaceae bacterium]|nr:DUF3463 domain-containing protein [Streptosporangiaceae bacterium]